MPQATVERGFAQQVAIVLGPGPEALAWFALLIGLLVVGALIARPTRARRLATVPFLLAYLLLPCLAPLPPFPRALLACLGLLGVLKVLQLGYEARWSAFHPVWHALSPFDVSTARRAPPAFDATLLAMIGLHVLLLAVLVAWLLHLPARGGMAREALRLCLGAGLVYAAVEIAAEVLRFGHRLAGVDVPPIQRTPVLSRSVREFWSERWNRPVSAWLGQYAFQPLARRRRPLQGLLAAFVASAALHAWMFYAALGLRAALSGAAFFLLQAPIVMLESKLGVARWPAPLARAWTLLMLLGTAPLFVAPLLPAFGL